MGLVVLRFSGWGWRVRFVFSEVKVRRCFVLKRKGAVYFRL